MHPFRYFYDTLPALSTTFIHDRKAMQLRDDEIHIIAAPLDTTLPEQWIDALNDDERERAARLHLPLHQQRFTNAHAEKNGNGSKFLARIAR